MLAGIAAMGLLLGFNPTSPAAAAEGKGVTKNSINIAIVVSDLDGLRKVGFPLAPIFTTSYLSKQWSGYFDAWNAAGGINGRKINYKTVTWDPLRPASMQDVCTKVTLDDKYFMVVQGTGFNPSFIECITKGGDTGFLFGGSVPKSILSNSGKNLITVAPPSETLAAAGLELLIKNGTIPKTARVGFVAGNTPSQKQVAAAARKLLQAAKISLEVDSEINTAQGDAAASGREAGALAVKMQDNGVTHVVNMLPFTQGPTAFATEAGKNGYKPKYLQLDTGSGTCAPFDATQLPAVFAGTRCVTAWDNAYNTKGKLTADTAFEKQCRTFFDKINGLTSVSGVPAGGVTDAKGNNINSDFAALECTLSNVLKKGLEKAGDNLTNDSFYDAVASLGNIDVAQASNGKGSIKAGKNWLSDFVHVVELKAADPRSEKLGADGLYDGCAAPRNCYRNINESWSALNTKL